jgi:hypothetical protein
VRAVPKVAEVAVLLKVVVVAVGVAAVTVTLTALDVLAVYEVLPPYEAVMECVPTDSEVVAMLALPEARVAVPREVVPS